MLFGASALVSPRPGQAATTTATIAVSATVLAYCTVTATPLAFGNYSPGVASTASSSVIVLCTPGTAYDVGLDAGGGTGATVSARKMTGAVNGSVLTYGLYATSARTAHWGNTAGTDTVTGSGSGLPQTLTVYGSIPANQPVPPGLYADTVTVTLTY